MNTKYTYKLKDGQLLICYGEEIVWQTFLVMTSFEEAEREKMINRMNLFINMLEVINGSQDGRFTDDFLRLGFNGFSKLEYEKTPVEPEQKKEHLRLVK